ncbi:MAG: type II secretion system protein J [Candidatus Hydrogenedentota bacterium]
MHKRGFTLLELLVAMAILVVLTGIVYGAFYSVVTSIQTSRTGMEEMRLRQFLARNMKQNFRTAYSDPRMEQEVFMFVGESNDGPDGARDSVRFASTTPLIGGMALPGDLKEVRYEAMAEQDSEMSLSYAGSETEDEPPAVLHSIETPLLGAEVQELDAADGFFVPSEEYEAPGWSVPIRSMRLDYFDGQEWLRDWDSLEMRRLPWAVRVRINFAKPEDVVEEEERQGIDPEEDPDFDMLIPLQPGLGVTDEMVLDGGFGGGSQEEGAVDESEQEDDQDAPSPDRGPGRGGVSGLGG